MSQLQFDADMSRRVQATYLTPDVVEQRRILLKHLDVQRGERVLDIGSGPGFLAKEMAERAGPAGTVHGIDRSESMLALSRELADAPGSAPTTFSPGSATSLPFDDDSFDVVTSTQVYEYVDDMPAALSEAFRVLRPGGRLLVLDTDWDSIVWRSGDQPRMKRILTAWDDHLADPHLPQRLSGLLGDAGFDVQSCTVIPLLNVGYTERSYSAGLIGFISAFVVGRGGLTETDVRDWTNDLVGLGPDYFFSINRYVFVGTTQPSQRFRT